jgi:hypothetical protein
MRHTLVAKASQKEHEENEKYNAQASKFSFHPHSSIRFKWDLLIALCTILLAIEIPLILGFQWEVAFWIHCIEVMMDPL